MIWLDIFSIITVCFLVFGVVIFLSLLWSLIARRPLVDSTEIDEPSKLSALPNLRRVSQVPSWYLSGLWSTPIHVILIILNVGGVIGIALTLAVIAYRIPKVSINPTDFPTQAPPPTATIEALTPLPTNKPVPTPNEQFAIQTPSLETPLPGFSEISTLQPVSTSTSTSTATPSPTDTPVPTATPTIRVPPPPVDEKKEGEIIWFVNEQRRANNCPELAYSTELTSAARRHSVDMAGRGVLDHNGSDGSWVNERVKDAGYRKKGVGASGWWMELIHWKWTDAASVVNSWMDDGGIPDGNRESIVNCSFRDIGAGYAQAQDGTPFWTVILAQGR